ncbi:hypothetical protein [Gelidibacter algens]|uniref:hypothetical protein n=1 Tax=Gelidibacter algens TaxID=49280 RepID=UPI001FEBBA87|nr:hypothetical protein [Gelidibacter algens]
MEKLKNSPLKIQGGISANGVYYNSNGRNSREPFTYFLQGNLNMSWLTFSMPLSYSFSNQGSNLGYQTPFKFNRLSIHPKYKWIQAHIGDVAMTFSPYTLSGHQFTGGGVELTPEGDFSISAMAGRLLKATEDDGQQQTLPAFRRMGYGTKLGWHKDRYKMGLTGFYAKDDIHSITAIPDDRNIAPKENLVVALDGEVTIAEHYTFKAEYASTAITKDLRAQTTDEKGSGLAAQLFNSRGSTEYYDAFKAGLDMQVDNMKVGVAYERIDPGYETLGAYFFNNDFENITLNASRPLFNNKLNLAFDIGYQRDNLDNQKAQATNRFVGALNATLRATNKITITGSYSNFSTHTNQRLNQFDAINDNDLTDDALQALEFKQLSQNANANLNWVLKEGELNSQNINLNYSLASSANEQAGIIRVGQANNFHNANAVYTIGFPKNSLNISTSLNYNYSDIGRDDSNAYGGGLDINKKLFGNKLNTTFGVAYNTNNNKENITNVLNFRVNGSMLVAEKHHFSLNAIQLFRSITAQDALNEITVTFGYAYAFDIGKPKLKIITKEKAFSFSYKLHTFTGDHELISREITSLIHSQEFNAIQDIDGIRLELSKLENDLKASENSSDQVYKNAGIAYLKLVYSHKDFLNTYHNLVFKGLKRLSVEASNFDYSLEKDYLDQLAIMNTAKASGKKISEIDTKNLAVKERKHQAHTWMQAQLNVLTLGDVLNDQEPLKEFRSKYLSKVFKMLENKKTNDEVELYLVGQLADFYHKKSIEFQD